MDTFSYLLGKKSGGGGGDLNWSAIDFASMPQSIIDGYNYAVQLKENWMPSKYTTLKNDLNLMFMPTVELPSTGTVTMNNTFEGCRTLLEVAEFDTSYVSQFGSTFKNCSALKNIPVFNTSKITWFKNMFSGCANLSDQSLDNILQMCINAEVYTGTTTLVELGLSSTSYSASKIQSLSHYQDFLDAGWTIGY